MAKQRSDDRQSPVVTIGDFPLACAGIEAGDFAGPGDGWREGESERPNWDRFFDYCDGVIRTALVVPADPAGRSRGLPPGNLGRAIGDAHVAVSRRQASRLVRDARPQQGGRYDPAGSAATGRVGDRNAGADGRRLRAALSGRRPRVRRPAVLADLESRVERRSYAVFFLRWFENQSFGQIASTLSLTPEQALARHHRESDVSSDRRGARRSRPGQGMIDKCSDRWSGDMPSRRSGRSTDAAGERRHDPSRAPELLPRTATLPLVSRHAATSAFTRPASGPRTPPRRGPRHRRRDATRGRFPESRTSPTADVIARAGRARGRNLGRSFPKSA